MKTPPHPELIRLILSRIKAKGYVGEKEIEGISSRLRIPSSRVYGFISQFDELPQRPSRARIRVCTGPACAEAGAWAVLEELRHAVPAGVEVLAQPGLLRWHRSPAVYLETPGEETRLVEGLGPDDVASLLAALAKNDLSSYRPLKEILPPGADALPGYAPAPWSAAAAGGMLPESWGPALIHRASEQRQEVMRGIVGRAVRGRSRDWDGSAPAVLLCDTAGPELENSVSFAAALLHPRAVVAGSALAAVACGARKLVFYIPWDEAEAGEALESAAAELLSGVGIKHSFFQGPAQVPCAMDIGRAAVMQGMMLWHAASLYGWKGTLGSDPSLAVLDAERAWRLPWLMEKRSVSEGEREGGRLVCLAGSDLAPRLLEIPPGIGLKEILGGLQIDEGDIKAVFMGGETAAMTTSQEAGAKALENARDIILLDTLTCMPRWALYRAWYAERACCGGCVPGRTVPAAAARILQRILKAEAGEAALEDLGSLLADAGGLALCPRLRETLNPILTCLREFGDEFEVHAKEGVCRSGSCSPAIAATTYGV